MAPSFRQTVKNIRNTRYKQLEVDIISDIIDFLPSQAQCYFLFCYVDRRIPLVVIDCPRNQLVASARHRNLPSVMLQNVPFYFSFGLTRSLWAIAVMAALRSECFRANQKQNKVEK